MQAADEQRYGAGRRRRPTTTTVSAISEDALGGGAMIDGDMECRITERVKDSVMGQLGFLYGACVVRSSGRWRRWREGSGRRCSDSWSTDF